MANWIVTLLLLALFVAVYFIPTFIAGFTRKRAVNAICALNLLLGWTVLGWVAALVWALIPDAEPAQPGQNR